MFTHPTPCVFLAPTATEKLLGLHKTLFGRFDSYSVEGQEYYRPGAWVPHCAADISTDIDVICRSAEYLTQTFRPFAAEVTRMGWVEVAKPVKHFEMFSLR